MRLIYTAGFSRLDREQHRVIIFANMAGSMKLILEAMDCYEIAFERPENEVCYTRPPAPVDFAVITRDHTLTITVLIAIC